MCFTILSNNKSGVTTPAPAAGEFQSVLTLTSATVGGDYHCKIEVTVDGTKVESSSTAVTLYVRGIYLQSLKN